MKTKNNIQDVEVAFLIPFRSQHHKNASIQSLLFVTLLALSLTSSAQQKRLSLETAVYLGTDAEGVFIGPALSAGLGFALVQQVIVSTNYTFYYSKISGPETFMTHTLDALITYQFQNMFNPKKGFFIGAGPAWQYRRQTPEIYAPERTSYWLGACSIGYRFPVKENKTISHLGVELKGFGPYIEKDPAGDYVEGLTQLMLGIRFRFN
jgi:hypothetical protein